MKFLLDMGISPKVGRVLVGLGHEASHLHEQGLDTLPDPLILEKARSEKAILLTQDLDFTDLIAASGEALPSIVIFRLHSMRPENVTSYLKRVLLQCRRELEQGAIVSVTEGLIRVRALPLDLPPRTPHPS